MCPCRSDYMDPNFEEANRKKISEFIVFVDSKLGVKTPIHIKKAANHTYGEGVVLNEVTEALCGRLSSLTEAQASEIIYNGKNKTSRKLADWWDEHVAADKARLKRELKAKKDKATRAEAISKLTEHERKVLGLK
jgi:hypothetical protein